MLDKLREQAASSPFPEETAPVVEEEAKPPKRSFDQIVGMNAKQRFALSLMLLIVVCLLGDSARIFL